MVWRWRKFRLNQVDGEARPRTRRAHPNAVEMLINSISLERWESESNIRKHGTTLGIKTVCFQMIPRNADKARFWGRKRDIFEYLAVQTTRQELHADFITFDYCKQGTANGYSLPCPLERNKRTYWDLPYLSSFCSFSLQKEGRLQVCSSSYLWERPKWHRMGGVF